MQTKIALYGQPSMKGLLASVNQISDGTLKVSNWLHIYKDIGELTIAESNFCR